jgi:predicted extracellular nuclease
VISQIFGGGGNANAPFRNDFIELFNRGATPIDLSGWSVQYAGATSATWSVTPLTPIILLPGRYYLIQQASGANNGVLLPQPDASGTIAMAAAAGKVALVRSTIALTGACPNDPNIIDLTGYGSTASCFKGNAPAPAASNTNAIIRKSDGCTDTLNNSSDFMAASPTPRNVASPVNICTQSTARNTCARSTTDIPARLTTGDSCAPAADPDHLRLIYAFVHRRNHFASRTLWLRQLPRRPT